MKDCVALRKRDWLGLNVCFFIEHFLGPKLFEKLFGKYKSNLENKIKVDFEETLPNSDFRIIELTNEDYTNPLIDKRNPVVYRNGAKDWLCTKEWNFEFFESNYGEDIVTIQDNIGIIDRDNPQTFSKLKLRDYLKELKAGSKKYLKFSRVIKDKETLEKYFDVKWLHKFKRFYTFGNTFFFLLRG